MKNILLGSIFMLVFLPQVSFGATQTPGSSFVDPALAAFQAHQDSESRDFFQQQSQERADFGKQNPDVMSKHDQRFKAMLAIDMARRTGKSTQGLDTPADEDPAFQAFVDKQRAEGQAFFAKLAQEKQAFLSSQGTTSTSSTSGT